MLNKAVSFYWTRTKYVILRRVCDRAVAWHVRLTPRRATPDTLTEIAQDNLALLVRKLEFRCHTLKERYQRIGTEIVNESSSK